MLLVLVNVLLVAVMPSYGGPFGLGGGSAKATPPAEKAKSAEDKTNKPAEKSKKEPEKKKVTAIEWEPELETESQLFPAYLIATATMEPDDDEEKDETL